MAGIKKFAIIISLFFPFLDVAQDIGYAKEIVETLASDEFKGRGYVGGGDKIAAEFIRAEFEKMGILPFRETFFQDFKTDVNTFPSSVGLSLDGVAKIPGVEYLVEPGSSGISGTYKTIRLEIDDFFDLEKLSGKLSSATGHFLIIPEYNKKDYSKEQQIRISEVINFIRFHPENPASGSILLTGDKLTWSASTVVHPKPSFTVTADSVPEHLEQIKVDIQNKFIRKYRSQNVIGYVEGENTDSLIVFTAHYDHLGMMGKNALFPGANDNASGIAMLLNLARYYTVHKPNYTTVFIAFGAEELGLVGARHFVENPLFQLSSIKFLLNFDIAGTGDDGIQVVNGTVYKDQFDRLSQINTEQTLLKQVKIRGEACNSDHCMFHMKQIPCFFIYTLGGIQAYHDIYDKSETLPLTEFEDYFRLVVEFVDEF